MKRVLSFGVGGFVGGYLAKEFQQYGYEVFLAVTQWDGIRKESPSKELIP